MYIKNMHGPTPLSCTTPLSSWAMSDIADQLWSGACVRKEIFFIHMSYDIASISETTTPIDKKFQDSIWTTKMCPAMQYCDVITNPRWRTAAILKIAKSPYLSEKSSGFDKIWYTKADIEPDDSHMTKN